MRLTVIIAALLMSAFAAFAALASQIAQEGGVCGTVAQVQCVEGTWCDPQPATCGDANAIGKCVRVSRICTREFRPVCGCNDRTYSNDCGRRAAQVGLNYTGKCWKDELKGK